MAIENSTKEYKTHKHKRTVYVDLNPKTKLGSDLIDQYHEQSKYHYMDIGRIGYHDDHGRYHIDNYTTRELVVVPKLIIRVTEKAMNRAGKDVYQLRTYMSKFGQLNFLLLVDQDKAELVLVENVYISNLNHMEEYETTLWILKYYNQKPLPLAEIFYKFGIKANPDDYGKSWKEKVEINNILTSKAKADMTIKMAETVASTINQKALVASLNYLNKEGEYGKKVTSAYSKKVANNKEINNLATSSKLENTLNHVLIKTLEEKTDKKDMKNTSNLRVYKKVLDIQLSTPSAVADYVEANNNKQNFKNYLLNIYQNDKQQDRSIDDIKIEHHKFEKIIDYKFSEKANKEKHEIKEETLDKKSFKGLSLPKEFKDFDNKIVKIDQNLERFEKEETKQEKKERLKTQKEAQKQAKLQNSIKNKKQRGLRRVNALCDIENEFEKSKVVIGLTPELSKKKSRKIKDIFEAKEERKAKKEEKIKSIFDKKQKEKDDILEKLEKKIKRQTSKKQDKIDKKQKEKEKKQKRAQERLEKKQIKREKQQLMKEYLSDKKEKKKTKKAIMTDNKEDKKQKNKKPLMEDKVVVKAKEEVNEKPNALKNEPLTKPQIQAKAEQERSNTVSHHKQEQPKKEKKQALDEQGKKSLVEDITFKLQSEKESSRKQEQPKASAFEKSLDATSAMNQKNFDYTMGRSKVKERTMDM